MKKAALLLFIFSTLFASCKKDKKVFLLEQDMIVGLHPCVRNYNNPTQSGFIVRLKSSEDVIAFGLPQSINANLESLVKGPPTYVDFFPPEKYIPVKISYRYATEEEKIYPICNGFVNVSGISKIKKEIIITDISLY